MYFFVLFRAFSCNTSSNRSYNKNVLFSIKSMFSENGSNKKCRRLSHADR